MSDLTFNKIAGAVLATGLAIVGLRELSAGVFAPETPEKAGYAVEVAEEAGGGAAQAELPPDWGTVLPAANVSAGEASFAKCKSCHTIDQGGANGTGPNLFGVVGATPAAHAGFAYSPAMQAFAGEHPVWTYDQLNEFIAAPQKHISGTKMTFVGIKKTEERVNLIAYLSAQGGKLPVPPPDPARQPGAAEPVAPAEGETVASEATGPATGATGPAASPTPLPGGPTGQGPGAPAITQGATAASPAPTRK
ncbi:MAG: c-type cytochrome [Pseudomonadota bacterium]|jgi:cytochrome c